MSITLPVPISRKDKTSPLNYRLIVLTNFLSKTMQTMINVILLNYFDQKGLLSTLQCGRRAKRTIIEHLLSFETIVIKVKANNEHVASVFFDMEKALDLTWRYDILEDFINLDITGRVFNFIQNVIQPRYIT